MLSDSEWPDITKYLSGDSSPEERERIEAWIHEDLDRRPIVEQLREVWEAADADPASRDVDAAWEKVERHLTAESDPAESSDTRASSPTRRVRRRPRHRSGRSRTRVGVAIAATCLLAVAVLVLLYDPTGSPTEAPEPRVVSTAPGERTTITLADGSSVVLNADSRLTVAASYGDERRSLRLEGEAYFEVEPGAPFVVKTASARVRVLGTAFDVRAYEEEDALSVVVEEGTVGVDPEGEEAGERTLSRKQRAVVSPDGAMHITSSVALHQYLGWREGRLVFKKTPLPDVIDDLERQYGLRIALLDSDLAGRRLTATFENRPLEDVLNIVALSLDIGYRRTDSTVVFGHPDRSDFQTPSVPRSRQK